MTRRLSLILGDADERALAAFVSAGTQEHEALQRWADEHDTGAVKSEAGALRALLHAGMATLSDEVLDMGYAELALTYSDADSHAERREARRRYAARTDPNVD